MGNVRKQTVLELGCGKGPYTRRLAAAGARVLAVDFSRDALLVNAAKLPDSDGVVGLVRANVGTFKTACGSFDLALSTLYSNLPSRELRLASSRLVCGALASTGRYVVTAHHYHLRDALSKAPKVSTYSNGIFYQAFERSEFKQEISEVFASVSVSPFDIWLPYVSRSATLRPHVSRVAEALPGVNLLGELLIAVATQG